MGSVFARSAATGYVSTVTEASDLAPLRLFERQPGVYCLVLVDVDMLPVMDARCSSTRLSSRR